jgi:hypothetical protein
MTKLASCLVLIGLCAMPAFAAATSFQNVPVVDVSCSKKVAANPDAHTRTCALACVKSGFGIVTKDQGFLKFDAAGNAQIAEALKASSAKDHLRVDVKGDVEGDTLKVSSIKLL